MCTDDTNYNPFPPQVQGGATGNYAFECVMDSNDFIEYNIVAIANGDGGPGAVIVSGQNAPSAGLDYTGIAANKLDVSNGASIPGIAFRISQYTTLTPPPQWRRVTSTEGKVFVRIDAQANTSIYVTIEFRAKILKTIPAVFKTVHPDDMYVVHQERAKKVEMAVLGKEGEREVYPRSLVGMQQARIKGQ